MYSLTPYSEDFPPFAWHRGKFNWNELNILQKQAITSNVPALVGNNNLLTDTRRSYISWLHIDEKNNWIFEKLSEIVSQLNSKYYQFDLTGFGEALQLTNYDEKNNGAYGWHKDFEEPGISRKLSLVLQLTDPSEYEGGNLQIMNSRGEPENVVKERGLICVFPSWTIHQVTPVTKGSRQTLVAWICGPRFK